MPPSLLVIDDDKTILEVVGRFLEQKNFKVFTAATGEAGLKIAKSNIPDIIVSDIGLPEMSGIEVCQALKRDPDTGSIPILLMTGADKEGQEIISLELGADDYLTKPFELPLLAAHINALSRRGPYVGKSNGVLEKNGVRLDIPKKIVKIDGIEYACLTPKEFDLFYVLVANAPTPLPREKLYHKAWGSAPASESVLRTVDVHIQRIRAKLNLDRKTGVVAVSGRGYKWAPAAATS